MAAITHQTTRLGVGRHDGPGPVVCVMELASMLAGERFSDRPASVSPMIAAILRAYNDLIDERLRADLYGYAADVVGTRADPRLQSRRAEVSLAWARSMQAAQAPAAPAPASAGRTRSRGRA